MKSGDLPVFPLAPEPVRPGVAPTVRAQTHEFEEFARVTGEAEGVDVVIVNTCGFIEAAKEQSVETILEACGMKAAGRLKAVVAVGCMVRRYKDELVAEIPEVDLFMGLTELQGLIPALRERKLLPEGERVPVMERPLRVLATETPHTSFLKISEGCDHTCAFCAIPLMRGLHRSQPMNALIAEAKSLGEAGVRELNIISQYTTEEGTLAADMPDQLPEPLKMERMNELMDLQREISFDRNLNQVGSVKHLLLDRILQGDESDEEFMAIGRTEGQAIDVDGVTNLLHGAELKKGEMVRVEIVDALEYDLIGKVVA